MQECYSPVFDHQVPICNDESLICRASKVFSMSNAQLVNLADANGFTTDSFSPVGSRPGFGIKANSKFKSTLPSGDGGLFSHPRCWRSALHCSSSAGIEIQPDATALGTLSADTTPSGSTFPVDSDEYDLDHPTVGLSSIPEAIEDIRQGKVSSFTVIMLDTNFTI